MTAAFSIPITVSGWWSMQYNLSVNWIKIKTAFEKTPVSLNNINYTVNTIQRFSLPNEFAIELSGLYSSGGLAGTTIREPFYQVDLGLQKKFGKKRDILSFTAGDIFNSGANYRFSENLPVANAYVSRNFNFQLVAYKLTYTHNFGNKALKEKQERATGAEEELKRVHN
jgi:hypothetical protein